MERYVPDIPFPNYSFVPGRHPHPLNDRLGHSFGRTESPSSPLDLNHPADSCDYLYGIDLFNAGFYWESHETWEGLWIAANRSGTLADFLKGLIKLAAAGVKVREGQLTGVARHARRAAELFRSIAATRLPGQRLFADLHLDELIGHAEELAEHPFIDATPTTGGFKVLKFTLALQQAQE